MKNKLKKILRKIPLIGGSAKLFYDWRQEKKQRAKINKFLAEEDLPFETEAPPKYAVGYEPTIRCNLRCKMCYQGQTRALRQSELTKDEVLSIFQKIEPKTKEIKLVGGEPFVREDILDLIAFWDKLGKRLILQTNCTLIDEKIVAAIKENKSISDILTSLDGPREIHDLIRGVPGAFDKLKKTIGLIKQNMPYVNITAFAAMLFYDNLDKLFELIDTAKELGLGSIVILFEQVYSSEDEQKTKKILKEVFGWGQESYRLNTQLRDPVFPANLDLAELKRKLSQARKYGLKKGCFVNFSPFDYYLHPNKYVAGKPGRPLCLKLLSPELRINQKGEVIWCDVIEKSFGSLLEKSPDEIWLSQDYQKFREYLFRNSLPICRRCCKASYV